MQEAPSNSADKDWSMCRIATISLYCAFGSLVLMAVGLCFLYIYTDLSVGLNNIAGMVGKILCLLGVVFWFIAFILGIVALVTLPFRKRDPTSYWIAVIGMLLPLITVMPSVALTLHKPSPMGNRIYCAWSLERLGREFRTHVEQHEGRLPSADNWCDLLLTKDNYFQDWHQCPSSGAKQRESSYALNRNIVGLDLDNIPPNVVLVFEMNMDIAKERWNQVGGPEMLTIENHKNHGANILFADGHVEFVRKKDIANLKWKP